MTFEEVAAQRAAYIRQIEALESLYSVELPRFIEDDEIEDGFDGEEVGYLLGWNYCLEEVLDAFCAIRNCSNKFTYDSNEYGDLPGTMDQVYYSIE